MDSPTGPRGGIAPPVDDTAAAVVDQLRQQNAQMSAMGHLLEEMRARVELGDIDRSRLQAMTVQDLRRQMTEAAARAARAEEQLEYLVDAIAKLTSRVNEQAAALTVAAATPTPPEVRTRESTFDGIRRQVPRTAPDVESCGWKRAQAKETRLDRARAW
jgi:chromosome segregation ATPase